MMLLIAAWVLAISAWLGCRQIFPKSREGTYDPRIPPDFSSIGSALKMYQINAGELPTQSQGLLALIKRPADLSPEKIWVRTISDLPVDPWGNEYGYVRDDRLPKGFGLCSKGRDGIAGTSDDVASWTDEK